MPRIMIQKFKLGITESQVIANVQGYPKPMTVQIQHGEVQMWMLVNLDQPPHDVTVRIFGTGFEMTGDPGNYVGTVQMMGGGLVWHIFTGVIGPIGGHGEKKAMPAAHQNPGEVSDYTKQLNKIVFGP